MRQPIGKIASLAQASLCAALIAGSPWASAQLETRGERDAAGAREQLRDMGEQAPTLEELSLAYDRASASWMQVFGDPPFANAEGGARRGAAALRARGWAAPDSWASVAMLDVRGDAAWVERGICRAQLNVGADGSSPVAKRMGPRAFEFLAAHELAHCLYDATAPQERAPSAASLLAPDFPVALSGSQARAILAMLASPNVEDGSDSLADAYDEALADTLAASALILQGDAPLEAMEAALSLRAGAASMAIRQSSAPPAHLGGWALWRIHAAGPATTLPQARALAMASVLAASLGPKVMPRWSQALQAADPERFGAARASAVAAYQPMLDSRSLESDEDHYLAARSPALFLMQLDEAPPRGPELTPEQAMAAWKAKAWIEASKEPEAP